MTRDNQIHLLNIENLSVQFLGMDQTPIPILEGIRVSVHEKEIVCLVGESGSGKTVTALSILRLLDLNANSRNSGSIRFHNKNLLQLAEKEMEKIRGNEISMIFQEPLTALNPLFTIGYQISEAITTHENVSATEAKERTIGLLNDVGFFDTASRFDFYPHQLSGGQRQRVMIAMALACNPSLLIADEPTTALDVTVEAQILRLLKDLQQQRRLSVLYITHDLSLTRQLAHFVYVMYNGTIVESGLPEELFTAPKHPYTMGLLASLPDVSRRGKPLYTIPGNVPAPAHRPAGCPFHPRCAYRIHTCETTLPQLMMYSNHHTARCPVLFEQKGDVS